MAFVFAVTDPLIFLVAGGIVAVLVIIAALYLKKTGRLGSPMERAPGQKQPRLAYQPEARPIPVVQPKAIPRPLPRSPGLPKPKEISLLNGRSDITQSLLALVEKYSFDQFTIATADGLVFASSGAETVQNDAALYGEMFTNNPHSDPPGVVLSGLSHKGSDLVLIIRTNLPVPDGIKQSVEKDTKDILNWWI